MSDILLKQQGPKTAENYANRLNVSNKTIYTDLVQVEKYLLSMGYQIVRKPGIGIEVSKKIKREVKENSQQKKVEIMVYPEDRQLKIMEILLFEEEIVTLQMLSEIFFVSVSSIKNDFRLIKNKILNSTTAELLSDSSGTHLVGTEEQLQRTYVLFNEEVLRLSESYLSEKDVSELLSKWYGSAIVDCCHEIVDNLGKSNLIIIAEHYKRNITNVLIVLAYRTSKKHHVDMEKKHFVHDEIMELPTYLVAKDMLSVIENMVNISFAESDIAFITRHLIANRIDFIATQPNVNSDFDESVKRIIAKMSTCLSIDLTKDEKLHQQLRIHFTPMIFRLKKEIIIQNPFLSQIKNEFRLVFDLTWFVFESEVEKLDIKMSEDEIGFIIIYFQAALDRIQKSKRVLIVCPTGILTSELVANRVRSILPPLDLVEVTSVQKMYESDLDKVDFIISTVPVSVKGKPSILVSPLITENDFINISLFYNKIFILKQDEFNTQDLDLKFLRKYVSSRHVLYNSLHLSKEEIIKKVSAILYDEGLVKEEFEQSIINREELGGTDLASGASIPHGLPKYVNKTTVIIWVNSQPVKWNEYFVRVVIFFCLANEDKTNDMKGILQDIYKLVETKSIVDLLFSNFSKTAFLKILGGKHID